MGADRPGRGASSAAAMLRRPGAAALGAALGLAVAAGRARAASSPASSPPLPPAASLALAPKAALPASPASPSEGARAPAMEPDDNDDYAFSSPPGAKMELTYASGAAQYTGKIPQCGVSGSRPRAAPGD